MNRMTWGMTRGITWRMTLICAAALLTQTACAPLVPLAVTAAGVTALDISKDRRTTGKYWDDNALEVKLRRAIGNDAALKGANVSVTVFNGVVLLTGEVGRDAQRRRAGALAAAHKKSGAAAHVVNELALSGSTNLSSRLNDSWITGKVKVRLAKADGLPGSAVKAITEHGKVYLMGKVTRREADLAVNAIRSIRGITHIVKVFEYTE